MKKGLLIILISILAGGCGEGKLTQEEVFEIIKQQHPYPGIVDYDIYCGDPAFAKRALQVGLDKRGLVTIQRSQKLKDVGKPLITFTEKAQPYLLPNPEKDKAVLIQRVKLAEEEIEKVTAINVSEDNTQALVEYTTNYKNINDFAEMTFINFNKINNHKALLFKFDKEWKLKK
jgi:hypothetical protein